MIRLYGNKASPFVRHCRIRLNETQLASEFIEISSSDYANVSATMRIPYLEADDDNGLIRLSDSSSILAYIASKINQPFLQSYQDLEFYTLANTLLDTSLNIFFLSKDGISADSSPYLVRQQERVESTLQHLNEHLNETINVEHIEFSDGVLRLACYLDWALFRQRLESLDHLPNLKTILDQANIWDLFSATPPLG